MGNKMKKYIIIFLIIILSSVQVWADCGYAPDLDSKQEGVTIYSHTKTIYYTGEGKIKANDNLIVWNKDTKELCFSVTTISNEYHNCSVDGKATKLKNNEYSYLQKECRVVLTFLKDKVKVNVTGPRGNFCVDDDLGGGCGMNAYIDSTTYKRTKKKENIP
jgi:hypothetical protein